MLINLEKKRKQTNQLIKIFQLTNYSFLYFFNDFEILFNLDHNVFPQQQKHTPTNQSTMFDNQYRLNDIFAHTHTQFDLSKKQNLL